MFDKFKPAFAFSSSFYVDQNDFFALSSKPTLLPGPTPSCRGPLGDSDWPLLVMRMVIPLRLLIEKIVNKSERASTAVIVRNTPMMRVTDGDASASAESGVFSSARRAAAAHCFT